MNRQRAAHDTTHDRHDVPSLEETVRMNLADKDLMETAVYRIARQIGSVGISPDEGMIRTFIRQEAEKCLWHTVVSQTISTKSEQVGAVLDVPNEGSKPASPAFPHQVLSAEEIIRMNLADKHFMHHVVRRIETRLESFGIYPDTGTVRAFIDREAERTIREESASLPGAGMTAIDVIQSIIDAEWADERANRWVARG